VNNKDAGFFLAKTGSLPSGVQSISFADIGMYSSLLDDFVPTKYNAAL
jgi:hypothetical protein